jgi:hypothetical protein
VRARRVGDSWLIIAVNVGRKPVEATLGVEGLGNSNLRVPLDGREIGASDGKIVDRFAPFDAKAYLAGTEPR